MPTAVPTDTALLRDKEAAIIALAQLYRDQKYALPSRLALLPLTAPLQEPHRSRRSRPLIPLPHGASPQSQNRQTQSVNLPNATFDRSLIPSPAPARTLLDLFQEIPGTGKAQIELTKENIDWAKSEKRIFLKQNLETRLVSLYIDNAAYRDALTLITSLLRELKRLDDKMILTEVHLLESRVNHALANMPKAKVNLSSLLP